MLLPDPEIEARETLRKKEIENVKTYVNMLSRTAHYEARRAGWYTDENGNDFEPNSGLRIALMHSELSEALEGLRKKKMDEHLPHRTSVEVELADAVIRIMDFCGYYGFDIGGAIWEKIEYNMNREDHKRENRLKEGGKAF